MGEIRKRCVVLLRTIGLLQVVENLRFFLNYVKSWKQNRRFLKENPEFVPPPAYHAYDAYNE